MPAFNIWDGGEGSMILSGEGGTGLEKKNLEGAMVGKYNG